MKGAGCLEINRSVDKILGEIIAVRRHIHQNPELSGCETATAKLVMERLGVLGISCQTVAGTGVVGLLEGALPGKTIALRADMDALNLLEETRLAFASTHPGVSHSCGHDIHTAVLLGCAAVLSEMRNSIKGNVKFIFQPAEESLSGAQQMLLADVLQHPGVDAIMALHCWPELPAGSIGLKRGSFMASSDSLDITVIGKAGHAAHPHKCIDPIVIAGHVLTGLQTIISREISPVDSAVITIGKIAGGTARNIIASTVELTGTVRTLTPATREKIPHLIERVVGKIAEGMNGEAVVRYLPGTPPVINSDALTTLVEQAAARALGADKVVYLENASMGGEDFAFYIEKVPGILFRLGTADENPDSRLALHNPKIVFSEEAIATGIVTLCEAALQYLRQE